ncbi:MAG: hypothetical protein KAU83_12165 [Bacteroidales bacterium]|nr:hypothetical protein [Bacteroidales bacterium]
MTKWRCVLKLNSTRKPVAGSIKALSDAIRRGADLRILTGFIHGEHIDPDSDSTEIIREVSEFAVTYLLKDYWVAGMMSLRQPISLPTGFGGVSSMSFFMYNQNGQQAIARPYLDGVSRKGIMGDSPFEQPPDMPKYHIINNWDEGTNAPSQNFIYDFEAFRYIVNDSWQEALSHDARGNIRSGSLKDLTDAFSEGCDVKIGVSGLCNDLTGSTSEAVDNEVFVKTGWTYYYTDQKLFMVGSHPVIRCKPGIPLQYESRGWDFGWLFVRSDGHVVYRRCDPYSLKFSDSEYRLPIRWFVR